MLSASLNGKTATPMWPAKCWRAVPPINAFAPKMRLKPSAQRPRLQNNQLCSLARGVMQTQPHTRMHLSLSA